MAFIQNEVAYYNAVDRRIKANYRKSHGDNWFAERPDRKELVEAMYGCGGQFMNKMIDSYHEWGALTEKQEAVVRKIVEDRKAKAVVWAAEDAKSEFVGEVGKRCKFEVIVGNIFEEEGYYGMQYVHAFKDEAGNRLVWRAAGRKIAAEKGDRIKIAAMVKKHHEGKRGKVTIINRVKREDIQ